MGRQARRVEKFRQELPTQAYLTPPPVTPTTYFASRQPKIVITIIKYTFLAQIAIPPSPALRRVPGGKPSDPTWSDRLPKEYGWQ